MVIETSGTLEKNEGFFLKLNFFLGINKLPFVVDGISAAGAGVELGRGSEVVVVVVVDDFRAESSANF